MGNTFDRVAIKQDARERIGVHRWQCAGIVLIVMLVNMLLGGLTAGLISIIVTGVLAVSVGGFYLRIWHDKNPDIADWFNDIISPDFLRRMGGMLWMQLKVMLWSLLLFIPGIIKAYAYTLTPYILYEYPNVSATEASRLSERIMNGHKMDMFIAQMSFLPWIIASAFTLGILNIVHVTPYMELTFAGIYEELKQIALDEGVITDAELNGAIN